MRKLGMFAMVMITFLICVACSETPNQQVANSTAGSVEKVNNIEAFGIIEAREVKNITIDFPSVVEKIHIKDGSRTKKGEVLAELNFSEYKKQLNEKEQELAAAKIELSKIQADINYLKANISESQADLDKNSDPELKKLISNVEYSEGLYNNALKDLKIKQELLALNAISKSELEQYSENVKSKEKELGDANKALEIARYTRQKSIERLQYELNQKLVYSNGVDSVKLIEGKIKVIEAEIKLMKEKMTKSYLKDNKIISDIDSGVVYNLGYVQGDLVDGSKKFLSIMDLNSIYVNAEIPEEFIKDVSLGSNVIIIPAADKSKQYKGKIIKIAGKAIQKNGETNVPIEISILDNDDFLVPNFNVDIEIDIAK